MTGTVRSRQGQALVPVLCLPHATFIGTVLNAKWVAAERGPWAYIQAMARRDHSQQWLAGTERIRMYY